MTFAAQKPTNHIFSKARKAIGDRLAAFLSKPRDQYQVFSTLTSEQLQQTLKIGDLILVEGNSRISTAIKYLTQSTWSHVCVYIGEQPHLNPLLEADLVEGVITVPMDKYAGLNLRICRPVNLSESDQQRLLEFLIGRIGHQYDKKNIVDLMRYLLPTPPIPQRFRRRLLEFGSGDPTKAICSTLVAQAFQSIRYPILPLHMNDKLCFLERIEHDDIRHKFASKKRNKKTIMSRRHYTFYTPRDFDLSPYFEVIKPTINAGFDYKSIVWIDT